MKQGITASVDVRILARLQILMAREGLNRSQAAEKALDAGLSELGLPPGTPISGAAPREEEVPEI